MERAIIINTLRKYFSHAHFRNGQEEIIESVLEGNDTLAIMPTGGGKSICYQIPALLLKSSAIVISPLISLMKDQVDALSKRGINSIYINSSLSAEETNTRLRKTIDGEYKLIYIAPERLKNKTFRQSLSAIDISFIAIDEAHCISEWGHDFRPAYLHIKDVLENIPRVPLIALTATATPEVQDDIISILRMKNPARFVKGFDRPNLSYSTENSTEKTTRIIEIIKRTQSGSSIVYCGSRKRVESTTEELMKRGLNVISYHAGMADKFRKYAQDKFINGDTKIIVATNAFGMGIDKPDVRNVIHIDLPSSIEAYYQEAGRAGRDGFQSECILLYNPSDRKLQEFFINITFPSFEQISKVYNYLFDLNSTILGSNSFDSIYLSDAEIGNAINLPALTVNSIIKLFEREKILKRGTSSGFASVQIITSEERIIEYYENSDSEKKKVLEALLRGVSSDVFTKTVQFDINHFMKKYDINYDEMQNSIRAFEFADLIKFHFPGFSNGITLLSKRVKCEDLSIDFNAMKARKQNAIKKLNMMQMYAETSECKRNFILNYFRDIGIKGVCGKCSSCLGLYPKDKILTEKQRYLQTKIYQAIYELGGNFGRTTICNYLKGSHNQQIQKYQLQSGQFYSSCKEYSIDDIKSCLEQEIYNGNLIITSDSYPTISVSENIGIKLHGIQKFKLNMIGSVTDDELLQKLKELRSHLATKHNVVERAIISDITLKKIVNERPENLDQIQNISGIGQVFMKNFAIKFLDVIRNYNQNLKKNNYEPTNEQQKIIEHIYNMKGISEIAKKMKKLDVDIAREIQIIIENNYPLNLNYMIDPIKFREILSIVQSKNDITLRELRNKVTYDIDFAHLRIMLAVARKRIELKKSHLSN